MSIVSLISCGRVIHILKKSVVNREQIKMGEKKNEPRKQVDTHQNLFNHVRIDTH